MADQTPNQTDQPSGPAGQPVSEQPAIVSWLHDLAGELGITEAEPGHAEIRQLLELARDAAHQVERPAAPLSTFLVGVAVGRGASVAEASEAASALALDRRRPDADS